MTNVKPIRGHEQVSQGCSFYTFSGTLVTKADFLFFFSYLKTVTQPPGDHGSFTGMAWLLKIMKSVVRHI